MSYYVIDPPIFFTTRSNVLNRPCELYLRDISCDLAVYKVNLDWSKNSNKSSIVIPNPTNIVEVHFLTKYPRMYLA